MRHPVMRPLNFVRSIPADGSINVSPFIRTIVLIFDNNLWDPWNWRKTRDKIQVWEGTRHLVKGVDYRLERSSGNRKKVFIKFFRHLAANTEYTVAIFPSFKERHREPCGPHWEPPFWDHCDGDRRGHSDCDNRDRRRHSDCGCPSPRRTAIIKFKTARRRRRMIPFPIEE